MKILQTEWEDFKSIRREADRRLQQKGRDFSLFAFLDGVAGAVGINGKIQYIKPLSQTEAERAIKTNGIEMGLDQITMKELLNFLYRVEYSGKLMCVRRIQIQKPLYDTNLQITLQVISYSKK